MVRKCPSAFSVGLFYHTSSGEESMLGLGCGLGRQGRGGRRGVRERGDIFISICLSIYTERDRLTKRENHKETETEAHAQGNKERQKELDHDQSDTQRNTQ